jgi:hypothetical protein
VKRIAIVLVLLVVLIVPLAAVVVTRVTVGTSATLVFTGHGGPTKILIRNPSAVSVYVGPVAVATTTGFEIAAGDSMSLVVEPYDPVYAIVAAATQVVQIIEGRAQ